MSCGEPNDWLGRPLFFAVPATVPTVSYVPPAIILEDIRRIVREEIERASPKVKTAEQAGYTFDYWKAIGWDDCLKAHGVWPEQK